MISRRSPFCRVLVLLAVTGIVPTLAACPKPPPPVPDADTASPAATDAGTLVIGPLDQDADADADAADAKPQPTGLPKPTEPLAVKVAACCAQLRTQSKANGNPPEFAQAITTCAATAAQLKTNPNAPELNALRPLLGMLSGVPACRSF
jgi:hypothetical protein